MDGAASIALTVEASTAAPGVEMSADRAMDSETLSSSGVVAWSDDSELSFVELQVDCGGVPNLSLFILG